ncbi:hypothetical protein J6590_072730 [Homalodisca vitripennis]|nr:hypothetical protein J6590_072730 [Homalodisca vitripennis]
MSTTKKPRTNLYIVSTLETLINRSRGVAIMRRIFATVTVMQSSIVFQPQSVRQGKVPITFMLAKLFNNYGEAYATYRTRTALYQTVVRSEWFDGQFEFDETHDYITACCRRRSKP